AGQMAAAPGVRALPPGRARGQAQAGLRHTAGRLAAWAAAGVGRGTAGRAPAGPRGLSTSRADPPQVAGAPPWLAQLERPDLERPDVPGVARALAERRRAARPRAAAPGDLCSGLAVLCTGIRPLEAR